MKKQRSKLWLKMTAIILFTVCVTAAAVCGAAVGVMVWRGVYMDGGGELRQSVLSGALFTRQMDMLEEYYKSVRRGDTEYYERRFAEENSNFFFTVEDEQGNVLLKNYYTDDCQYSASRECRIWIDERDVHGEGLYFDSYEERWDYIADKIDRYRDVGYNVWDADMDGDGQYECCLSISYTVGEWKNLTLNGYVKSELTARDAMAAAMYWVDVLISMRYMLIVLMLLALACALALFVFLICSAGHKEGVEGIYLGWQDRIPFDLYLAVTAALLLFGLAALDGVNPIIWLGVWLVPAALLTLSAVMTFAARAKAGEWWRNTVIFRIMMLIKRAALLIAGGAAYVFRSLPFKPRALLMWAAVAAFELFIVSEYNYGGGEIMRWLIPEKLILTAVILHTVSSMKRLKRAGEEMAGGNISYTVELGHMHGELKAHGENLNSISGGIQRAVDERMRSERLKTELITNVSHDIKTPITSIVNYVDLLKKEQIGSERAAEYLGILERQSARLKKLTEDLVEASKASSGSMTVNTERVNVNLLLSQAAAEYEEKMNAKGVEPILSQDAANPEILADGRLMWRVFDNLLSNICKYSMPGTRAYLSTETDGARVKITFKNISAYQLNISGDELTERFVRGDTSRSTEGSGLGLSIAMSLTELQHGVFAVSTDGDLFKTELEFDTLKE